jgi:ribose/xylose/arabinose/galactoside ABC-type transport system permease subunit
MNSVATSFASRRQQMYFVAPTLLVVFFVVLLFLHRSGLTCQAASVITAHIVKEGAPFALMAIGESLVIAAGSIDLSVVGNIAVSGTIFAALTQLGIQPLLASLACALWGVALGWALGFIMTKTYAPALITTWSIGVIALLSTVVFGGAGIVRGTPSAIPLGFVTSADFWSTTSAGFLSVLFILSVAILTLNWSNFPNFCCAVGASRKAALYAGIDSAQVVRWSFALSGLFSATSGIFWSLLANSSTTTDHIGKELVVIAVAVLGGTSLAGGYLSILSVVASAFFWAAAKTLVDTLDLVVIGSLQSEAASGIFALVLLAVVLVFSRQLATYEGTVFYRQSSE